MPRGLGCPSTCPSRTCPRRGSIASAPVRGLLSLPPPPPPPPQLVRCDTRGAAWPAVPAAQTPLPAPPAPPAAPSPSPSAFLHQPHYLGCACCGLHLGSVSVLQQTLCRTLLTTRTQQPTAPFFCSLVSRPTTTGRCRRQRRPRDTASPSPATPTTVAPGHSPHRPRARHCTRRRASPSLQRLPAQPQVGSP